MYTSICIRVYNVRILIIDCREEFDIVFVLDSSWSLRTEKNFRKEIHFVTELSDNLQLDFKRVSVSVITYADQAKEYNFRSKNEFSSAVLNLPWLGGNTYTDRALSIVLENVENRANSVQSTVERPLVVLVITDGGSTSPFVLEKVVARLKRFKFVKLFAIGMYIFYIFMSFKVPCYWRVLAVAQKNNSRPLIYNF